MWTATVAVADLPNGNGRIYPADLLRQIVNNFGRRKFTMFGRLNPPLDDEKARSATASHTVEHLYMDGPRLMADILVWPDTADGQRLRALLEQGGSGDLGGPVVFRTTGIGRTYAMADGTDRVLPGYRLRSIDAYTRPGSAERGVVS